MSNNDIGTIAALPAPLTNDVFKTGLAIAARIGSFEADQRRSVSRDALITDAVAVFEGALRGALP